MKEFVATAELPLGVRAAFAVLFERAAFQLAFYRARNDDAFTVSEWMPVHDGDAEHVRGQRLCCYTMRDGGGASRAPRPPPA